ncbi:hypothetical protein BJF83_10570 [Nocardiopsis sp. CNR-923]|uniref:hypothetical protein n=1 Tax=Nocardiopsis sp. CNR-923 TaxID=1904965 RepID=UPI00095B90D4|nr:hypothetical protein [Nocardiopsis sp. CNR-923]OLT29591.1 hypothetical protein BJF83_10570 [Nocardiopsis sp. CNR-923]
MKFELVDPPEDAASGACDPEAARSLTGRRSGIGPSAIPHVGPIEGDLGRVRLNRAVEQARAVVEDLRARAAEQSMAETGTNGTNTPDPGDDVQPLLFRARSGRKASETEARTGGVVTPEERDR